MYGSFIRAIRDLRGLSQETLAAVAGIPQPNLSAYERDRRVPSLETLNRIVVACGLELAATDGGEKTIWCPLPRAGWFPDEDLPGPEPGDPGGRDPVVRPDASPVQRAQALADVLELAEATRSHLR